MTPSGPSARRLLAYLRPYIWPWFVAALACMILYSSSSGAVPWLVRSLIDDIFQKRDERMLAYLPGVIIVVFGLRGVVNFGQAYLSEYVGQRIVYDLRSALQEKIQHLPLSFFDRASTANVVARITSDVLLVRQALTEGVASMIRDTTTVIILVIVAFWMDATLATLAFVVVPAIVLPLQSMSRRMRKLSHRGLDTLGGLSTLLQETVQGARVVKAFGMEDYEKGRFAEENDRLLVLYLKAAWIKALTTPMTEVFSAFGIAAVLWWGGTSVLAGGRTSGSFLAFMTSIVLIYEPFKKLIRTNNNVQTGLGAAERVFELVDIPAEPGSEEGGVRLDGVRDAIRLENVSFAYDEIEVLHGIDLEIGGGKVLALVGPSGAGKSTIADLIPRFYQPTSGKVTIDGVDIRDMSLASLRANIAVVTQQTFLFNDTVRANIAYGRQGQNQDEIEAAARAANAHEFIEKLPKGYDTEVGELGVQLSGGQRQRLAIARALLKDAPILILDEATSALDTESERLVQSAIARLMQGRTSLVIAHRLSTIQRADAIAVVSDGRVVELGRHEELLAGGSLYRRLYDMQFREDDDGQALEEAREEAHEDAADGPAEKTETD